MNSLKVLYVNSFCGKLSTGRIVSNLSNTVIKSGGAAHICFGRDEDPSDTSCISENVNSRLSLYSHAFLSRITDSQGKWSVAATKKIIRAIETFKPNIIHLHNLHGYYLNYGMLTEYLKKTNIPIVFTMHDCWLMTGHCCHFMYENCDKYLKSCGSCPAKNSYPSSMILDRSEKNLMLKKKAFSDLPKTVIVSPSQWLADIASQTYLSQYPIKVINNGIRSDIFYPHDHKHLTSKYGLTDKKIVLAVSNVWTKQKGINDILALSHILPDEYKLVVIGTVPSKKAKITDSILFIEHTDNADEMAQWYSAAHIFVNPTYEDTFPTVNLEALACGTPIISYNTGGSCECIENGCGVCVTEKTPKALAQAITDFNTTDEVRQKCIDISKKYDASFMYKAYMGLYRSII